MIELQEVVAGYQGRAVSSPLTGKFRAGSMTAVIGANGTGKSTLLKTLIKLQPPVSGNVIFARSIMPRVAWLPQLAEMDRQFPATVYDVVSMGGWPATGIFSALGRRKRQQVAEAIERVGLSGMSRQPIVTLSGGQFQRMLFARLLIQKAPLVLLDEPFTGVDIQTTNFLMLLIRQMHEAGQTVITVLHDNELVGRFFPETLLLGHESACWGRTAQVLPHYQPAAFHVASSA
ncbi:metal ABC transporter ATP-binding protein [Dryocola clanedunensis]|uniref:metal ABC transporter ATP-binding protein n=1 Tax=Cedecea sulfonylureivorans TaxID=3051154 RepID=UPI001927AC2B|nr:ATP-binding cassette domain-containing protein [Cedecea sulfonylureivorans]